ncbi:lipopolysaccharide biosynthesis protein [Ideonella azotifigens]|uniref:Lipopolysaccharide biosynthesis protein n=1 Tax=Ideonella azotifigens TaxID=513160 RepID=A0ABP3USH2_9BURK|nr:lipopolysaccharide biosynthesis protein [Ideonella azotifigens]MCD2342059.1 lipopolysaccharide biosynthesis protein [Ideonella azotifigens]
MTEKTTPPHPSEPALPPAGPDAPAGRHLSRKVTSAVASTSVFHGAGMGFDLLLTALLSRLLTPADYGIVAAAMLFLALCNLLREVGIGATVVQLQQLSKRDQRTGMTLVLMSAVLLFGVAQACARAFADFMHLPAAEGALRFLSLIIVIQAFSTVAEGLLLRRLQVSRVMKAELGAKMLAYTGVGIGLALAGAGYWALVGAMLAEALLRAVALIWLAKPELTPLLDRECARRLLGTGGGFTASRVLNFIALRADVTIVGRHLDAASLGLYSRAYKLMSMPTDLYAKVADRVVFPAMARVQDEPERLRTAYLRGVQLTALMGLPLTAAVFLLAPDLVAVLLGPQWTAVVPVFSVLAIGTYFRLGARVSGSLLRAKGAVRELVISQAFYAVLTIGGSLYAVRHGLVAVGMAVGLAIVLWFVLITVQACRAVGVSVGAFLAAHGHGLLLGAVLGVALWSLRYGLHRLEVPAPAVLLAAGAALALLAGLLVAWPRAALLGRDGATLAGQVQGACRRRLYRAFHRSPREAT